MNTIKLPRPKPCKVCREKFQPTRAIQPTCQKFSCQVAYAEQAAAKSAKKREQEAKKQHRKQQQEFKDRTKTLTQYANEAQAAFNAWKRYVDLAAGYGCISCNTYTASQWQAGHYRTRKAANQLRFNPDNVHLQCSVCNSHDSGNIVEYRINLVKRIGLARVEVLECDNTVKRWTKEELIAIRKEYQEKLKVLKQQERKAA